jgi:hypothetical protein
MLDGVKPPAESGVKPPHSKGFVASRAIALNEAALT